MHRYQFPGDEHAHRDISAVVDVSLQDMPHINAADVVTDLIHTYGLDIADGNDLKLSEEEFWAVVTRHDAAMIRYLNRTEFAERIGVAPGALSRYRLPEPDVLIGTVRGWKAETVDRWNANRPGQGARTDLAV